MTEGKESPRAIKRWSRLSRDTVNTLSLEVFKTQLDNQRHAEVPYSLTLSQHLFHIQNEIYVKIFNFHYRRICSFSEIKICVCENHVSLTTF